MQFGKTEVVYRNRMKKLIFLSKEEEDALGMRMEEGDEKARHTLIERYTFLVGKIVSEFRHNRSRIDADELWQAGFEGLLVAVNRWKYSKGRFGAFAWWYVRVHIATFVYDNSSLISVSPSHIRRQSSIKKKTLELAGELGRQPTTEEVALKLALPVATVARALVWKQIEVASLDEPITSHVTGDELTTRGEMYSDPAALDGELYTEALDLIKNLKAKIAQLVKMVNEDPKLGKRSKEIFLLVYGLKEEKIDKRRTLEEVAVMMHVSKERVRQVIGRIIKQFYNIQYYNKSDPLFEEIEQIQRLEELVSAR